jgi:hypothetical protein
MKRSYQLYAILMLLVLFGMAGTDCLPANTPINASEKACCLDMAEQCDMGMPAQHSCCKNVERHITAKPAETQTFDQFVLAFLLPVFESAPPGRTFNSSFAELLGSPPTRSISSSITVLRI